MKKIPLKNYIILGIILAMSTIIVLIINNCLLSINDQKKEKTIITQIIHEITPNDFDNYILENPNFVIYMASKDNCTNISFEKNLKKFLIDNDLETEFIFINLDEMTNETYIKFIQKYYNGTNVPTFNNSIIVIENQKIRDILNGDKLKIKEVKKFLKDNGVY